MQGQLNGKIAVVTGGSRGIGRAVADLFVREGARVYVTDREVPAEDFTSPLVHFTKADVASEAGWQDLINVIASRDGAVDILVNNAGISGSNLAVVDERLDEWNNVLSVNLNGTFLGMRAVLPGMRAKKSGSIINFSSIYGVAAAPLAAGYMASKAAVRHLTKHAAVAYAPDNVRVNSVHPGIIATPYVINQQKEEVSAAVIAATPMGRMGQPEEIAKGVLFLASDQSSFVTGAELVIDGGFLAQ